MSGDLYRVQKGTKDAPCNLMVVYEIYEGRLNASVFNRSNDLVWGALGANVVHFSVLQEYIAFKLGIDVGTYHQISNNLHGYVSTIEPLRDLVLLQGLESPYVIGRIHPYPMICDDAFERDLKRLDFGVEKYESDYFQNVVSPVQQAHAYYKVNSLTAALSMANQIAALDWRKACTEWLQRRIDKRALKKAQDDGVVYET